MAWLLVWMLGAAGAWGAPGTNVPQMTVIHTKYGPVWRASTAARVAPVRPRAWVQVPVSDGERQIARAAAERADALLRAGGLPRVAGDTCRDAPARTAASDRTGMRMSGGLTHFYDRSGFPVGSSRTSGGLTHFYDGTGFPIGSSRTSGGQTHFYDGTGFLIGSSRTSGGD
jgi:hypothetical protein